MNKTLCAASIVAFLLTGIHVFAGGADVHAPILMSDLDPVLKGFSSVVWHAVSANLLLCSLALFVAAKNEALRLPFCLFVGVHYLAYICLFVFYGISRFSSVLVMLPWIAFVLILIIMAFGLWREYQSRAVK